MDEESLVKKRNKAQRDGNVQILSNVQKKLGDLYFDKKQYDDALEAYKGQLQACECLNDKLNSAIAHRMIGEVYADIGDFKEALNHQNLYLDIAKELEDLIEEQRAFATLGRTYLLVADSLVKDSQNAKKMEALKDAKRAFSKSIKLCDKLEKKIDVTELMMMRARLLLNLGLVLEQQKDIEQALNLINHAASLCKKHNLNEDFHRTNIALTGINERLGNFELALKHADNAIKVDDIYLKAEAKLAKAELFLRLGEWIEAKKVLHNLYKSKKLLAPVKQQVVKLLKIAVLLCRSEDKLLVENNSLIKEKLYESMGDAAVVVKSFDKAVYFYKKMLSCAEENKSSQIGAALTSLAQTLRDAGKYQEAIPYARKELEMCIDSKEACNSALYLAGLLIDAKTPDKEIRDTYDKALTFAKKSKDPNLEKNVLKDLVLYLEAKEDVDLNEIESLNEKLTSFNSLVIDDEESEEEETETPDIGADICLDELSDIENEEFSIDPPKNISRNVMRKPRCIVKKNEKGETALHVACIKGNVSAVERLLEEQHPTTVRDNCGWTPLHEASNHGHIEIVRLLLRAGADVNDPGGANCDGVTALHDAAANGHTEVVNLLLDNGADANLLTRTGESALDCLEQWRDRIGDLSTTQLTEFVHTKNRLKKVTTVKKSKKRREAPKWNALLDDDDDESKVDDRLKTLDNWSKPEKISVGEDYKRTIASMQHPGRLSIATKAPSAPKITAPLIDSEDMLVDDWLEDDLGVTRKEKIFRDDFPPAKRKSKNDSDQEIDWDADKSMKRQKVCPSSVERELVSTNCNNEDSCDSVKATSEDYVEQEKWPKTKKKPRQTNLLKQGFTKLASSPSPEPIYVPANLRPENERHSWELGYVSDTLDLEIQVDEESFNLKLHSRDLRKNMTDIEDLIRHKFEAKTGCKPKISFKTVEDVILAAEVTLEELPKERNKLKLIGKITQNDLPPMVDRYKKICETLNIEITESMIKSLKSCDNTSTFRLNTTNTVIEELEPLSKCIHYQKNLQTLILSGATFFNCGELLNHTIAQLSNLCELHLQCCDIDFDCLSKIDKLPVETRVLDLSYNPLGSKSQKKLYNLIEPLKRLQTLNLRYCEIDDFQYPFSNNCLVNLDISWNPIGGEGAANFLQRQMLSLNLSNTQNFFKQRVNVIDKIFFSDLLGFSFFALETLELSSCEATDLDVEKILSQSPNLARINLSNNMNVTKTSLCALLKRKPTMNYIDLSGCRLIEDEPESNLRIVNPQLCTLLVHMKSDVVHTWEVLWQNRGYSKRLPHSLVVFKPT